MAVGGDSGLVGSLQASSKPPARSVVKEAEDDVILRQSAKVAPTGIVSLTYALGVLPSGTVITMV